MLSLQAVCSHLHRHVQGLYTACLSLHFWLFAGIFRSSTFRHLLSSTAYKSIFRIQYTSVHQSSFVWVLQTQEKKSLLAFFTSAAQFIGWMDGVLVLLWVENKFTATNLFLSKWGDWLIEPLNSLKVVSWSRNMSRKCKISKVVYFMCFASVFI